MEGCGKTFTTKGDLARHKRETHGGLIFLCDKETKYGKPYALRQHRQKTHGYLKSTCGPLELFIEQPKPPKQPPPPAPPPSEALVPECIDAESNSNPFFFFGIGLEEDDAIESKSNNAHWGEQVSPLIWADTLLPLTKGQKTAFKLLADQKHCIRSTIDEDKECEDCGCLISWRSCLLRFKEKPGSLQFSGTKYCEVCNTRMRREKGETIAKERYGVEGPVSKLWTLPAIQPSIAKQLQDMYCRTPDCGAKISHENALYDRSSSMDHLPVQERHLSSPTSKGTVSVLRSSHLRFIRSSFKWQLTSGNHAFGVAPNSAMNVVPILDIFFDRDVPERIEFLDQLANEMPAGVIWGDMVLDKIENFDEQAEKKRPDVDPELRRRFHDFKRHRFDIGKEERIQDWTFQKYRFYLEACQGRSVLTGMWPRKCGHFDRCINTDPYDLDTVVFMEKEFNFMKADFWEFKDEKEYNRSQEKSKTRWAVKILRKHLFKFLEDTNESKLCSQTATIPPDFRDPNAVTLAEDVERIYRCIVNREQGGLREPQDIDSDVKALAGERVKLEFLARLLFLQLLLSNNPDLEPQEFFREQTTTGGAATISHLVHKLREYDNYTIQAMLGDIQTKLHLLLVPKRRGLVIALDEAQVAINGILAGKLISPSALIQNRNVLFDGKGQIQTKYRRGFLTPLSATLNNMQATLVILGTALSLQDADHVTDFPRFARVEIDKMLSDLVDMSDCDIPPVKCRKLSGRARFSTGVVNGLVATGSVQNSKQATLDNAIDDTIEHVMSGLRSGVRTILESDKTGEAARLLCRMVLAYHLQDAKISFLSHPQSDFVDKALCRLRPHSDGVHMVMDEPMVVEAVQEELKASNKDPEFSEYLDQIYRIVTNHGAKSTSKGAALELLARRSLQRFNGFHLRDLPFLQGITLPSWCDDFQLQIDSINTASGFGYIASGIAADLEFLMACPPNKMLVAYSGTRPDGAWFFSDKRYAGSLAIKLYGDSVPQDIHHENETSSDIRRCFLKKDGITVNASLAELRQTFEKSSIPSNIKGILRIHMEFPHVARPRPVTHVRRDPTTGVEDVMVYIDISNMDSFFDERVAAYAEDMVKLKRLIKFVCNSV
ncbi:hypothetical protein EC968_005730 [Mortierella alpina]|nr:hypothetical protein EC968_005730 [Mortierella alpina]